MEQTVQVGGISGVVIRSDAPIGTVVHEGLVGTAILSGNLSGTFALTDGALKTAEAATHARYAIITNSEDDPIVIIAVQDDDADPV